MRCPPRYFAPAVLVLGVLLSTVALLPHAKAYPRRATSGGSTEVVLTVPPTGVAEEGAAVGSARAEAAPGESSVLVAEVREAFDVQASFTVSALATKGEDARRALDEAHRAYRDVFADLDAARETSELSRLNRTAGREAMTVSPLLFAMVRELREVALLSGGAFDPTDGPLRVAAASEVEEVVSLTSPAASPALDAARELVSYETLLLDAPSRRIGMGREGQSVHLGRAAYATALQSAANRLRQAGFLDYVLRAGSEVLVSGKHEGRPWRVGVQDPGGPGHFAVLELVEGYVSTAGEYETIRPISGALEHSAFDPRSGVLVTHMRSVTIIAQDPSRAASLARAVFVLGPEEGLALVRRLSGAEALVVTADDRVLWTDGISELLRWRPPTPRSSVRTGTQ